jgi:hypothetical protein
MGKILFEKQQHEFQISFNPLTYYALILSIIDIYLTRRLLSANRVQVPERRSNEGNDMQSNNSQPQYQESNESNRGRVEEDDIDEDEEFGMDVESNDGDTTNQRDDSSLPEIKLDNLTIKQDFGPKTLESFTRNNKNYVFPHQQNGFKVSPQTNNSFRQTQQGNIFQSPTPLSHQTQPQQSPNIFQQGSPSSSMTNSGFFKNLFDSQNQQQQFSPNPTNNQNSRRQPNNHIWS